MIPNITLKTPEPAATVVVQPLLRDLVDQRRQLELAILEARERELPAALAMVRDVIALFELTAEQVFPQMEKQSEHCLDSIASKSSSLAGVNSAGGLLPAVNVPNRDRQPHEVLSVDQELT